MVNKIWACTLIAMYFKHMILFIYWSFLDSLLITHHSYKGIHLKQVTTSCTFTFIRLPRLCHVPPRWIVGVRIFIYLNGHDNSDVVMVIWDCSLNYYMPHNDKLSYWCGWEINVAYFNSLLRVEIVWSLQNPGHLLDLPTNSWPTPWALPSSRTKVAC